MPSPINPPIITPQVAAVTYDTWFYTNFQCSNLHDEAHATLSFDRVPKSADGQYLWSHRETITRPFWEIVQHVAGAGAVLQSVINILPAIAQYEGGQP
jgi:hypothetical protein